LRSASRRSPFSAGRRSSSCSRVRPRACASAVAATSRAGCGVSKTARRAVRPGSALASDSRLRRHGRLVLVGDFLDCEPRDLLALATAARELVLVQILAREELAAPPHGIVRWIDAESGAERTLRVDASAALAYERRLQQRLDAWRTSATRARAFHGLWTSDAVFEDVVQASGA